MANTNTTTNPTTNPTTPPASKPRRKRGLNVALTAVAAVAILGAGIGIGAAAHTHVTTRTATVTKTVQVPGPTVTKTVPAPPPPAGTVVGTWSGTGNQATPAFNAPASGNYVVSWTYSGNIDPQMGGANNFIINANDQSAMADGLPNDIAASGSGSTEVTGASGVESFNVQATGQWTIKVVTAP